MPPCALITGASSGIGLSFARCLAARGHDLVLVARDLQRLEATAAELAQAYGGHVDALAADLGTHTGLSVVEARLAQGSVDLLVNNAGFGLARPFLDTPVDVEEHALDVMVRAPLRLSHAALTAMRARVAVSSGEPVRGVINVSSVAGFLPRGTYGAHKAWLTSFSQSLQLTYGTSGLHVMALCPGFVRTQFHDRIGVAPDRVPRWMWLDADAVVRAALHDFEVGRVVSVPARRYRVLTTLARHLPLRLVGRAANLGR